MMMRTYNMSSLNLKRVTVGIVLCSVACVLTSLLSMALVSVWRSTTLFPITRSDAPATGTKNNPCRLPWYGNFYWGCLGLDARRKSTWNWSNSTKTNRTTTRVTKPEQWIGPRGYVTFKNKQPLQRQCKSCSLVNSAGRVLATGAGPDIDAADCVLRMNDAPAGDAYQDDVGIRTTFRVIGHRNVPKILFTMRQRRRYLSDDATKSDVVVVWHYGVQWKNSGPERWCNAFCVMYHRVNVYLATDDTMKRNERMFYEELNIPKSEVKIWMSTGWGAMLFALDICESIDVYGMIYEDFCRDHPNDTHPYHYYDSKSTECSYYNRSEGAKRTGHKFLTEKAVFAKWAASYGINFYHPSWEGHLAGHGMESTEDTLLSKREYREHGNGTAKEPKGTSHPNQLDIKNYT